MSKFICSICGEIKPKNVDYGFPQGGDCPNCGKRVVNNETIKVLTEEEARAKRPELYRMLDEQKKMSIKRITSR